MSTHPNVILMAHLTPDDLARATYRAIRNEAGIPEDEVCPEISISGTDYYVKVMEEDYDEDNQISAKEGDIVLYHLVTYGFGEAIEWEKLAKLKDDLQAWCRAACEKHHCTFKILIGANYW